MPLDESYLQRLFGELVSKGVVLNQGLSDEEIAHAESTYGFRFPPDFRALLQFALPVSESFPNWRRGWISRPIIEWRDRTSIVSGHNLIPIQEQIDWPAAGIIFDIEHSNFWSDAWGPKPEDVKAAVAVARKELAIVPSLIPIYSHRYIPTEPCASGNPVFSVYQTDVIYYGFDLASYFAHEFGVSTPEWAATEPRDILFWSALTD